MEITANASWSMPPSRYTGPRAASGGNADTFTPAEPPLKIWLVHGSYTGGHASAARALKEALDNKGGVESEVINQAELSTNPMPLSLAAEKSLESGPLMGEIRRWCIEQSFAGNPVTYWASNQGMKVEAFFTEELRKRIQTEKPDVVVATMSPTSAMLSYWHREGEIDPPVHTVVTDFSAHSIWAQSDIARYYVASEATAKDLQKFGVKDEQIAVEGIPIRPAFGGAPRDRAEVKKLLGLDPNKPLGLMLGGALGYGDFNSKVEALDGLKEDFQVAVICGRNEAAKDKLEAASFKHPVTARGFVDNMPDWLEAADLVISKPGGLTTSEVLARGRAMLILDPLPGMEMMNVQRLKGAGAVRVCQGMQGVIQDVQRLLAHPDEREALEKAAATLGKPNSASNIADHLISAAREQRALVNERARRFQDSDF